MQRSEGFLILEDGKSFRGHTIGTWQHALGEVVFNTSMTGYQEILTDPSYAEQIIVMTYPLIGNYGISTQSAESASIHASGLIVSESCNSPSHWQSFGALDSFLVSNNVAGLAGVDTRALTRHLRAHGTLRGVFVTELSAEAEWHNTLMLHKSAANITDKVTTLLPYCAKPSGSWRVAVIDYGAKAGIIRALSALDAEVWVYPCSSHATEILASKPDAVVLSNGPGNPEDCTHAILTTRELIRHTPTMGICLGHQILGLALGGEAYRLKFGHRGGNHPVKDLISGRAFITAQNHGYAIAESAKSTFVVTHNNINDGSIEGIKHKELPVFSVQFHPEASPGPNDALALFETLRSHACGSVNYA